MRTSTPRAHPAHGHSRQTEPALRLPTVGVAGSGVEPLALDAT
ncbi:hypothetical protein I552_2192 [Mycobacterium xenopi 3993]|nr:hypothetical protein I552_2192 [Mycobacterium xenopi 3993]